MKKGIIYFIPFLLALGIFAIFPLVKIIILSLQEGYDFFSGSYDSIGFDNFYEVLSSRIFLSAIINTVVYSISSVLLSLIISIFLANILSKNSLINRFLQTAFFMPLVTSSVAVCLVWRFMFNESFGIINYFITLCGFDPIQWFSTTKYELILLILYGTWDLIPITLLLMLSAFQSINKNIVISAKLDTASEMKIFWRVKLPLVGKMILTVSILNFISCIKVFDALFPLFNGRPGTMYDLYTIVYYVYYQMFERQNYGVAAAASILAILIIVLIIIIFRLCSFLYHKYGGNQSAHN